MKQKKPISEREFARLVGASLSTVQRRRADGRLALSASQDAKGRWRIDPTLGREEWRTLAPAQAGGPKDAASLAAWRAARARREAAEASLAEDELRRSRGEFLLAAVVEARMVEVFSSCKTKLLALPSRLRQRQPDLTLGQVAAVDALIREALEDLAGSELKP